MSVPSTSEVPSGLSTTLLLSLAAVGAALVAIFGEKQGFTAITVACALAGLLPWALVAGGVRLRPAVFALLGLPPGVVAVAVAHNSGGMFPLMMVLVWLAHSPRASISTLVTAAAMLAAITSLCIQTGPDESGIIFFTAGMGIAWMTGAMLRRQETLTAQVQAMRDVQVAETAATERARIAREVHDVVAHSLTVVLLNLTGARRALATQPERADEALARAEAVGRDSLDSIRQVMGVLRAPGDGATLPAPALAGIAGLVEGARGAGLDLEASLDLPGLSGVPVDATVELVAYRVVQEALANVLQHAPGATASLDVAAEGADLVIRIENAPVPVPPASDPRARRGLGTLGMAERTRAVGGTFESGPTPSSGWRVQARLPLIGAADGATLAGPTTR